MRKLVALTLCAFLLYGFYSCAQPTGTAQNTTVNQKPADGDGDNGDGGTGDTGDTGDTPIVDPSVEVAAACDALDIAKAVIPNGSIVTMPLPVALPAYPGVSISWVSGDVDVIAISGSSAYVSPPSLSKAVMIKATVSSGSVSKEKTFVVKVFASGDASITDSDYLEAAKVILDVPYDVNKAYQSVKLNASLANNISVTWESSNPRIVKESYPSGNFVYYTIVKDVADTIVTLKATLRRNNETVIKEFALRIPRLTRTRIVDSDYTFKSSSATQTLEYSFGDNTITYMETIRDNATSKIVYADGTKYSITVNLDKGTLLASVTDRYTSFTMNGYELDYSVCAWYTKSQYRDASLTLYSGLLGDAIHSEIDRYMDASFPTNVPYQYGMVEWGVNDAITYPDIVVFRVKSCYDASKPWYNQIGDYAKDTIGNDSWSIPKGFIHSHVEIDDNYVAGTFSSDYSTFTEETSGKVWKIIADSANAALTFTSGSETLLFYFVGEPME